MKAYILRDMPDPLWRFIRSQADLRGITIREYLIPVLAEIEERTAGKQD
jgi:hypothetical protein